MSDIETGNFAMLYHECDGYQPSAPKSKLSTGDNDEDAIDSGNAEPPAPKSLKKSTDCNENNAIEEI
ncbi:hypothetical protein BGZ68_003486 [Mortierella alpina]|nr:hypothetical protein BGZ68_003486 [Mortierella alpina]